jgi:hypothetical protein
MVTSTCPGWSTWTRGWHHSSTWDWAASPTWPMRLREGKPQPPLFGRFGGTPKFKGGNMEAKAAPWPHLSGLFKARVGIGALHQKP